MKIHFRIKFNFSAFKVIKSAGVKTSSVCHVTIFLKHWTKQCALNFELTAKFLGFYLMSTNNSTKTKHKPLIQYPNKKYLNDGKSSWMERESDKGKTKERKMYEKQSIENMYSAWVTSISVNIFIAVKRHFSYTIYITILCALVPDTQLTKYIYG